MTFPRLRRHVLRAALALGVAVASTSVPTSAGVIEGVAFEPRLRVDDTPLELAGLGLLRYRVLFRGYVAALYLPTDVDPAAALTDVPKRLEIEYFWPIDGDAIARAGDALLRRNVSPETLAALASRLRDQLRGGR